MPSRFVLAQITDMHVRAPGKDDGFEPLDRLLRALEEVAAYNVDAIVATGDLVNDERPEEYALLAEALARAPAPVYLAPGNHDCRALIRDYFPHHDYLPREGRLSYAIEHTTLRIVAIDQTVDGETHGLFSQEHADWLEQTLAARPDAPTLIALHHPPIATFDRLLDRIGLFQAELFASVIARHAQVKRIVCGHAHRAVFGQIAHAPVFVCPSTAWTFSLSLNPDQPVARRTAETDGWALHVWEDGVGMVTHVMGID